MLEPRRLAAKAIAERMAAILGEQVGQQVGYRIRFETRVSERTCVEVVTDGVFLRILQADNTLEDYAVVIFDEIHERSIQVDLAFVLVGDLQRNLRPELKLLMMSATLSVAAIQRITGAAILESRGRQYPVEQIYTGDADPWELALATARVILRVLREKNGDVLVFLPGEREIHQCEKFLLAEQLPLRIHSLYGMLDTINQRAAILPDPGGQRKIILSTSIAETSLTIEGVSVVVDSGYTRKPRFDPRSGLSRLETVFITGDSAEQRSGRAGRLRPGTAYRMWTPARQQNLIPHQLPEIMEADLAGLVLELARWGITDRDQLNWLTTPPDGNFQQAVSLLNSLGALDGKKLTPHGMKMSSLACHPRIAHLLLSVRDRSNLGLATDLAALLEERDPMGREGKADVNLRLEILRRQRKTGKLAAGFRQIGKVASRYRKWMNADIDNRVVHPFLTGVLLAYAYPERIACRSKGEDGLFQLSNGKFARVDRQDDLSAEPWLAVAHLNQGDKTGRIFLASPVHPDDLKLMIVKREVIEWDSRKKELIVRQELRIGNLLLKAVPMEQPDRKKMKAAMLAVIKKEGDVLLNFDPETMQLQNRVRFLRKWEEDSDWPDFSTDQLLQTCESWLSSYLDGVVNARHLKKINLKEVLFYSLTYEQQSRLQKEAPERLKVPSGSWLQLNYPLNGNAPVLAVRIQEIFGLTTTPRIGKGKISILLHLLSPGYKPVQVTNDLPGFWATTYFEVRKELKRRYPKHSWPDNPLNEPAVRGTGRRTKK